MRQCPECGKWSYYHDAFTMCYICYKCGRKETPEEKALDILRAKFLTVMRAIEPLLSETSSKKE